MLRFLTPQHARIDMEYVCVQDAIEKVCHNCVIHEYPTQNSEMNIGIAHIAGRYPQQGYAINHECLEMGYVIEGTGKVVTENQEVFLSKGDVVAIPQGEKYYWEGHLTLVLPCTPAWYPQQHEIVATNQKASIPSHN